MTKKLLVFSHGLESGPWGSKITSMAEIGKKAGFDVISVDYQGMREPQPRVDKLLQTLAENRADCVVLVGSSMGGHVATAAANEQPVAGLFVLAPAFFMPGYETLTPAVPACPMQIVHGWHDDVVPLENSLRFARAAAVPLAIVDSDHRLGSALPVINEMLADFLHRCCAAAKAQ
ncbi:MAG: alpha/beta fold hydrolase [Pseudomonadota bacterium]